MHTHSLFIQLRPANPGASLLRENKGWSFKEGRSTSSAINKASNSQTLFGGNGRVFADNRFRVKIMGLELRSGCVGLG